MTATAVEQPIIRARALCHIVVMVTDFDRAKTFYTRLFGFDRFHENQDQTGMRQAFGFVGGVVIELFHRPDIHPVVSDINAAGLACISFSVPDIDAAYSDLKAMDVAFVTADGPVPLGNARVLFLRDPDGTLIQLIQHRDGVSSVGDLAPRLRAGLKE